MGILALAADERVKDVHLSDEALSVDLMDGRTIIVPLTWYPKLLNASSEQRNNWQICGAGYMVFIGRRLMKIQAPKTYSGVLRQHNKNSLRRKFLI